MRKTIATLAIGVAALGIVGGPAGATTDHRSLLQDPDVAQETRTLLIAPTVTHIDSRQPIELDCVPKPSPFASKAAFAGVLAGTGGNPPGTRPC